MKSFALLATIVTLLLAVVSAAPYEKRGNKHPKVGRFVKEPSYFTSAVSTRAVDSTIINNAGASVPGQTGAYGHFQFRINSDKEIICYDIRTVGVTGNYMSPALTATHIHQAPAGSAGPPRIAFPNPTFQRTDVNGAEVRTSKGCLQGPFTTGIQVNGKDSGSASGFRLSQIESDPSAFFSDTHTETFSAGAIRGQLLPSERKVSRPRHFTSTLKTTATPGQVVSSTNAPVEGLQGAKGYYRFDINVDKNVICYDIKLTGFEGQEYFSPAKTATHSHMAKAGLSGPPRLAFENPQRKRLWWGGKSKHRYSKACIKGPFTTGLIGANGLDTGSASGFTLQQLQDSASDYMADVHTESKQAGAVRGQLARA